MAKIILVLLDGLNCKAAHECMCYPDMLRQTGQARNMTIWAELPPLSRPVYATLITGLAPLEHGIVRNEDTSRCNFSTIFSAAHSAGFHICAAAYYWFYELCAGGPFNPMKHRCCAEPCQGIDHAFFYSHDEYPDAELFADAEALRMLYNPDFLLVHSMGIDYAGHLHGGESCQYMDAVANADNLLALYLPVWISAGYDILILSDHGMNAAGRHYDRTQICRQTPVWLIGNVWNNIPAPQKQTDIARVLSLALGLDWLPGAI